MKCLYTFLCLCLIALIVSPLISQPILVPGINALTIQAGLDSAQNGDTVLVAPGIYTGIGNKELDFLGKAVVLISNQGPTQTIIDCEDAGRGLYFHTAEDTTSVVSGFTITGASNGGITCAYSSSPTIHNCIIEQNFRSDGGGISCFYSSKPLIYSCIIQNNTSGNRGGGIHLSEHCDAVIRDCEILDNHAGAGGAISCDEAGPIIRNCLIARDTAALGGAFYGYYPYYIKQPTLINCTVSQNVSTNQGTIYLTNANSNTSSILIRNTIIWDNVANPNFDIPYSDISFTNIEGGWIGIGNQNQNPFFQNPQQGDFHLKAASPCIDEGHPSDAFGFEPAFNGGRINMGRYGNTPEATSYAPHPIIAHYAPRIACVLGGELLQIEGIHFGPSQGSGTVTVDGTLLSINSWSDTLVICSLPSLPAGSKDIILTDGNGIADTVFSRLTYEPEFIYVNGPVSGRWSNQGCPAIYVITGDVYVPHGDTLIIEAGITVLVDTDSTMSPATFAIEGSLFADGIETDSIIFSVRPGQEVAGAWKGFLVEEDQLAEFTFCRIEYAETAIQSNSDKARIAHCLIQHNAEHGIWWDGDEVSASGIVVESLIQNNGEWGIFCDAYCRTLYGYASPSIEGNVITHNGLGGIYARARGGSPSTYIGQTDKAFANPKVYRNRIEQNTGYAILILANGVFTNGIPFVHFSRAYASPVISNNLIINNEKSLKASAPFSGNTISYLSESQTTMTNNTFWNNGHLFIEAGDSAHVAVNNTIAWEDSANILTDGGAAVLISHSNLAQTYSGSNNLSIYPQFVDTANKDFHLLSSSPCVDSGDSSLVQDQLDVEGAVRIWDGDADGNIAVDMGAYELGAPLPLQLLLTTHDPHCMGANDGTAIASPIGGTSPYTFVWDNPSVDTDSMVTDLFANLVYHVTVTDANNLTYTDSLVLSEPLPLQTFLWEQTATCSSDSTASIDLTISGGVAPYSYAWSNGASSQDIYNLPIGIYSVNITDANGCVTSDSVEIVALFASPHVNLGPDSSICDGELLVLDAGSGFSAYNWSNGFTGQQQSITSSNLLSVSVQDSNGCWSETDSVNIIVHALPVVSVDTLAAICVNTAPIPLNLGSPSGGIYSGQGLINGSFDPAIAGIGTHILTYEFTDAFSCTNTASTSITVLDVPTVNLGPDLNICQAVQIDAGNPGASYQWSTGETSQMIMIQEPSSSDTISVIVTLPTGCNASDELMVNPGIRPEVNLPAEIKVCGDTILDAGNSGAIFIWSTGESSQSIMVDSSALYTVTVSDTLGCSSQVDVLVTITPFPIAAISYSTDGLTYSFITPSVQEAQYFWDLGDGNTGQTDSLSHTYTYSGSYQVVLTSSNACGVAIDSVLLLNVSVANPFDQQFQVFPNPSTGRFTVMSSDLQASNLSIELTDSRGRKILYREKRQVIGLREEIDIQEEAEGIYMLRISDGKHLTSFRLVKK